MENNAVLCVLNAKYIHASPSVFCLLAGVKAYKPNLYDRINIVEATINQPASDIIEKIVSYSPRVITFSCYLWNITKTLELCTKIKKLLPDAIIVLGGPEVSYRAQDVLLNNLQIDYILCGEGEESYPVFLQEIFKDKNSRFLPQKCQSLIGGICGRNEDGTLYINEPCVLTGNVPSPISAGYHKALNGRIAYFETSRGCPYSCAFCLSGRCGVPRYFSDDKIFDNLIKLANSDTNIIKFVDRTFNANPNHANKILKFILENYGKQIPRGTCFHFEIAGDILKEETFELLKKMPVGAIQLEIGMQSFCEKTLDAINRKTNTDILKANIRRLISFNNMHIHIDLIAGLPYEDLDTFKKSFNIGYSLNAQMLQLGFLKLLHGSPMRNSPNDYPCEFDKNPPYEVYYTPWLSENDLELLHCTEDALERVYNSGRFRISADYILKTVKITPFDFYTQLGIKFKKLSLSQKITLDDYTEFFYKYCCENFKIDKEQLRDNLVRDRLSTNNTGRLPKCLLREDILHSKAVKALAKNPNTAPKKGVHRGVALLYGSNSICYVDYVPSEKNPVTSRWKLNELSLDIIK